MKSCHFESLLEGKNFCGEGVNTADAPCSDSILESNQWDFVQNIIRTFSWNLLWITEKEYKWNTETLFKNMLSKGLLNIKYYKNVDTNLRMKFWGELREIQNVLFSKNWTFY